MGLRFIYMYIYVVFRIKVLICHGNHGNHAADMRNELVTRLDGEQLQLRLGPKNKCQLVAHAIAEVGCGCGWCCVCILCMGMFGM